MKSELRYRRGATCGNDNMSPFLLCFGVGRVIDMTWRFLVKSESPDHVSDGVMTITSCLCQCGSLVFFKFAAWSYLFLLSNVCCVLSFSVAVVV
jgi:accessory gene regulator protein AgrB